MIKIYYLAALDKIPRYVGKTKQSLKDRLSKHKSEAKNKDVAHVYKNCWIKSNDYNIDIYLIDEVPENEWEFWEEFWIEQFKIWNFKLTNISKGGKFDKFYINHNRKNIPKLKKSLKGRKLSKEHVEAIRKARTGWIFSKETKAKISKSHTGKKLSDATKEKISKSKKGTISEKKISINQYDKNGNFITTWDSTTTAAKELNLIRENIVAVLKGRRKTCGKFIFKYCESY